MRTRHLAHALALAVACAAEPVVDGTDGEGAAQAITARYAASTAAETTANLNLRAGPATTYAVVAVIPVGSRVTLVDGVPREGWYRVAWGARVGWCSGTRLVVRGAPTPTPSPTPSPTPAPTMRPLPARATWHVDIEPPIDTAVDAQVFDVDLFGTDPSVIAALRARGRRVVCYFSAGSWEEWRPDAASFPRAALGRPMDEWPGERWLDVRHEGVRAVMRARLGLARAKGCEGVDPDNVDGWDNDTGFALTADDELAFLRALASEAHARGLLVGLKNDLPQVPALAGTFDFAVNEECARPDYDECAALAPFVRLGKPVFHVEYVKPDAWSSVSAITRAVCPRSASLGLFTVAAPADRMDGRYTRCVDGRSF